MIFLAKLLIMFTLFTSAMCAIGIGLTALDRYVNPPVCGARR